ncbi:Hypothetical predicted protein [Lecanosticta acicola]|uniref:Uncharacterized protein n=1 Tax=Lecanosticta acicola TaxID=111012 RepID=A0AAI9EE11_9PEZI|nr:Hypothetical predicted protein [Lecanosticta acicola]
MNDVNILHRHSTQTAIGTRGLNGCSAIVICGTEAIILAHIAPYPGATQPGPRDIGQESYNHHAVYLSRVSSFLQTRSQSFPQTTTAWGVFSTDPDGGYLRHIVQQVERHLQALGYRTQRTFYQEIEVPDFQSPKGEVISGFNARGRAELWVEGGKHWEASATEATSLTSAAQFWRGYPVRRNNDGQAVLACKVNGNPAAIRVTFPDGVGPPRALVSGVWVQTELDDRATLVIRQANKTIRMEKPTSPT